MEDPSGPVAALLRSDASVFKGFADAVLAEDDWDDINLLVGKLEETQVAALRQRLAKNGRSAAFKPVTALAIT